MVGNAIRCWSLAHEFPNSGERRPKLPIPQRFVCSEPGHVYVDFGLPSDLQWTHVLQFFRVLFLI